MSAQHVFDLIVIAMFAISAFYFDRYRKHRSIWYWMGETHKATQKNQPDYAKYLAEDLKGMSRQSDRLSNISAVLAFATALCFAISAIWTLQVGHL